MAEKKEMGTGKSLLIYGGVTVALLVVIGIVMAFIS